VSGEVPTATMPAPVFVARESSRALRKG